MEPEQTLGPFGYKSLSRSLILVGRKKAFSLRFSVSPKGQHHQLLIRGEKRYRNKGKAARNNSAVMGQGPGFALVNIWSNLICSSEFFYRN